MAKCLKVSTYAMLILLLAGCSGMGARPQVAVETGLLQGSMEQRGVTSFKGVPYAAAPVGELRWRAPQPPVAWAGVKSARRYAPHCAQPLSAVSGFQQEPMSEDCLALNVWTPAVNAATPLPVMVWIHGGGYSIGSGNKVKTNSPALASEGVVLVTLNYRLSAFGFLTHPALRAVSPDDPYGNYGLQDVIAALEWIQRNIAAFGGDPQRVTVFGESAGAGLVNALLVAPPAAGLFHGAISQSASVGLAPVPYPNRRAGFLPPTEKLGAEFAKSLGVNPQLEAGAAAAQLRAASMEQILAVSSDRDRYTPVIDGELLPDQVGALFAAGRQHSVPYITGGNSWEASLGRDIGGGFSPEFSARLVPAADKERLYSGLSGEPLEDAIFGDLIVLSASRFVAGRMHAQGAPVYRYYLSYLPTARRGKQPGVAHEDDIAFVMQTLNTEPDLDALSQQDWARSKLLSQYWAEFARTGDPNAPGLPSWPAFSPSAPAVLEIGDEIEARPEMFEARMDFHIQRGNDLLRRARN